MGPIIRLVLVPVVTLFSAQIVWADTVPETIPAVIQACSPVIELEYNGDKSRWNDCVTATDAFLTFIQGPPVAPEPAKLAGDLVFELAKLYQSGQPCKSYDTELPNAIEDASKAADAGQRQLILQIAATIRSCQTIETGAIQVGTAVSPT